LLLRSGASPDLSNKALKPLQDLKARIASQTSIAQIFYLQGQGGELMDEAIALVEAAGKPAAVVATPGATTQPISTGSPNVTHVVSKPTRVVRAADLAAKSYLETEADVDAYLAKLKTELLAVIKAGQKARLQ